MRVQVRVARCWSAHLHRQVPAPPPPLPLPLSVPLLHLRSQVHVVLNIPTNINPANGVGRPPVASLPLRLEGCPPRQVQGLPAQSEVQSHGRDCGDGVMRCVETGPGVRGAMPHRNGRALQSGHEGGAASDKQRL